VLAGLDEIPWTRLEHAYGRAGDTPRLLRQVGGDDKEARGKAFEELWSSLCHQGTVYEATASAVPFLAALARKAPMPEEQRRELVALLGSIAAGRGYLWAHREFIRTDRGWTEADEEASKRELRVVEAARQAVAREFPGLVEALGGVDRRMDWSLAFAASQVPEVASSALSLVSRLSESVTEPHLAAALALTSELATREDPAAAVERAMGSLDGDDLVEAEAERGSVPERWPRLVAELLFERGFEEQDVR